MTPWGFGLPLPYPKISPGLRGNGKLHHWTAWNSSLHLRPLVPRWHPSEWPVLKPGWVGWCSISMIDGKRWNHDTSSIGRKTLAGMPKASVVSSKQSWTERSDWCDLDVKGLNPEADSYKHKIWHHTGRSQSSLQSLRLVWKSKDANRARTAPPTIDASVLLRAIRVLGGHYFWGSWRCLLHM